MKRHPQSHRNNNHKTLDGEDMNQRMSQNLQTLTIMKRRNVPFIRFLIVLIILMYSNISYAANLSDGKTEAYQEEIYKQSLDIIRPFLAQHNSFILYGNRIYCFDDYKHSSSALYNYIVITSDSKAYYIYPHLKHTASNDEFRFALEYNMEQSDISYIAQLINSLNLNQKSAKEIFSEMFNPESYKDELSIRYSPKYSPLFRNNNVELYILFNDKGVIDYIFLGDKEGQRISSEFKTILFYCYYFLQYAYHIYQ